jgi:hypothetical protein
VSVATTPDRDPELQPLPELTRGCSLPRLDGGRRGNVGAAVPKVSEVALWPARPLHSIRSRSTDAVTKARENSGLDDQVTTTI